MERLRETLAQHSRWKELELYVDRMEGHLESDFSISIENAKALLESIGKEICLSKNVSLVGSPSVNAVLKKAFLALGYSNDDLVQKVSGSLATIGQELGNLRNQISPTSHGKSLIELRQRNDNVDLMTREFLIDSTLVVAIFLIRSFEERKSVEKVHSEGSTDEIPLNYNELEEFNDFWDGIYGEFEMAEYAYTASEILFNVDYRAYETEYKAFSESSQQEETDGDGL